MLFFQIKPILVLALIISTGIFADLFSQNTLNVTKKNMEGKFTFRAAYNWAETRDVNGEDQVFTKGGTIAGSWSWSFANGSKGNTHFISASLFRSNPYSLVGTIELNMFEITGDPKDVLYISYDGIETNYKTGTTSIKAVFVGGKGMFRNASGSLNWVSINGFIDKGGGVLNLKE